MAQGTHLRLYLHYRPRPLHDHRQTSYLSNTAAPTTLPTMSDYDSLDYLQPDFEAKSLTIPRLRSVLVAHNVTYPANAKKAQLVEIFEQNVRPQAKKILDQRARAKRSSKGIFDAESQDSGNPFDEPEVVPPLPPQQPPASVRSRRSASPRKASSRLRSEEPEYGFAAPPRSPSKRSSRASSRQLQASDTENAPEMESIETPRVRQSRPPVKKETSDEAFFRRESGAFSTENPFQSGSSPAAEQTPGARRRTTGFGYTQETPRPASTHSPRRRTDYSDVDDDANMTKSLELPARNMFRAKTPDLPPPGPMVPTRRLAQAKTPELPPPEPMIEPTFDEPGEEFTPEEQLELNAEEARNAGHAVVPARQNRPVGRTGFGTSFSVMLISLLVVYAGWYRQEKIAIGYCDVGRGWGSIPNELPVPEWAQSTLGEEVAIPQSVKDALEPQCEPCPPHAYCYGDFSVECEPDYILKPHPFALGGLVPLPPTCEPDGEKVRRVQAVADRAVEELRERTAKFECGELVNEDGVKADSPAIDEQELKKVISQKRSKKMSNQEFDDLWGAAIGEIKAREEVEVKGDTTE